jgi:predicted signal transduction protein with EAL and GGDEF domain
VRGSIELAHAIGATVVAEGIETHEQWKLVRELGCDIAQGYFVGRPAPAEEVTLLLQSPPVERVDHFSSAALVQRERSLRDLEHEVPRRNAVGLE